MHPSPLGASSTLESLTEAQRDHLYDWLVDLTTKEVVEKIAQPAPDGFGIKTHPTTLRRFKDKHWAELAADRIQAATQLAQQGTSSPSQVETLDTGIQVAIRHHMFERVSSAKITDDQLAMVSRWSQRQEKLKLETQRVLIARERCNQNNLRLQILARSKSNPLLNGWGTDRVSAQANISSAVFHPCPTPIPLVPQTPNTSAISASNSPSNNSEFLIPTSDLMSRPCDELGPLARNWEEIRERARKAFGITPEESARRAKLRRTYVDPGSYEVPQPSAASNKSNYCSIASLPYLTASDSPQESQESQEPQDTSPATTQENSGSSTEMKTERSADEPCPLNLLDILRAVTPARVFSQVKNENHNETRSGARGGS